MRSIETNAQDVLWWTIVSAEDATSTLRGSIDCGGRGATWDMFLRVLTRVRDPVESAKSIERKNDTVGSYASVILRARRGVGHPVKSSCRRMCVTEQTRKTNFDALDVFDRTRSVT